MLKRKSRKILRFSWPWATTDSCWYICIACDHVRRWFRLLRASLASRYPRTMLFHQHGSDRTPREIFRRHAESSRRVKFSQGCDRRSNRKTSPPGISHAFCKKVWWLTKDFFFAKWEIWGRNRKRKFSFYIQLWPFRSIVQTRKSRHAYYIVPSETKLPKQLK